MTNSPAAVTCSAPHVMSAGAVDPLQLERQRGAGLGSPLAALAALAEAKDGSPPKRRFCTSSSRAMSAVELESAPRGAAGGSEARHLSPARGGSQDDAPRKGGAMAAPSARGLGVCTARAA